MSCRNLSVAIRVMMAFSILLSVPLTALAQGGAGETPMDAAAKAESASPPANNYHEDYKSPEGAALRSIVIPGWGQHYNGESNKGWILTSVAALGLLLGTELIAPGILARGDEDNNLERSLGWFLYGGSVAWATVDAYLRAEIINRENGYEFALDPRSTGAVRVTLMRVDF